MSGETVFMCTNDAASNYWMHGHVTRDKIRGAALGSSMLRDELGVQPSDIFKAKVVPGWVLTVDGGDALCGYDQTVYFVTEKPEGGTYGVNYDDDDKEVPAEIVDGPHEATWLEIGQ